MPVRIGFIGLGNMGGPMAANLVKAGHKVTGFDLSPVALEALAKWPPLRDALLTSGLLQVAAEAARVHPAEASVQVRCLRPARNL